jgi:hypothetical protein
MGKTTTRSRAEVGGAPAVSASTSPPGGPAKWWHWLLIYPTLAVSILTAAPQWFDRIQALANDVRDRNFREAEEQSALYAKNLTCTTAPFDWYLNPNNVNLDATICESGDIYVRASAPDRPSAYYFVAVDRILGVDEPARTKVAAAAAGSARFTAAAVDPEDLLIRVQSPSQFPLRPPAQRMQQAVLTEVICTKFVDKRVVLRHLRTPQACFDEWVDTLNGRTQKRVQTACRKAC